MCGNFKKLELIPQEFNSKDFTLVHKGQTIHESITSKYT